MATIKSNPFLEYELSPQEELTGQVLSQEQQQVLQNLRAKIHLDKMNLVFTPNDILSYTQQEASLAGQISIINYIFDMHEAASNAVNLMHQEAHQTNETVIHSQSDSSYNMFKPTE